MEGHQVLFSLTFLTLLLSTIQPSIQTSPPSIQITNGCHDDIWPGVHTTKGPVVHPTGFHMKYLDVVTLDIPSLPWSGRIWARTQCSSAGQSRRFHCAVGDCGTGLVRCNNKPPQPPVGVVELHLDRKGGRDFYKINLIDGFNMPVSVTPSDNSCKTIKCLTDLRIKCPSWLTMYHNGAKVACKSACMVTHHPKDCCTGEFNNMYKCGFNPYSDLVEKECFNGVSHAFDFRNYTCFGGSSYVLNFIC